MKLYIVHCGFLDRSIPSAVYEGHTNFFIAAKNFADAKKAVKLLPDFKRLKMHVDSLQEIESVDGYEVKLVEKKSLNGATQIHFKNPWAR